MKRSSFWLWSSGRRPSSASWSSSSSKSPPTTPRCSASSKTCWTPSTTSFTPSPSARLQVTLDLFEAPSAFIFTFVKDNTEFNDTPANQSNQMSPQQIEPRIHCLSHVGVCVCVCVRWWIAQKEKVTLLEIPQKLPHQCNECDLFPPEKMWTYQKEDSYMPFNCVVSKWQGRFFFSSFLSAASKTVMMQDTPTAFTDCAAVFKSGNTQSGVYTLTLPNNTTEVKVKSFCLLRNNTTLLIKRRTCSALCWKGAAVECKCSQTFH